MRGTRIFAALLLVVLLCGCGQKTWEPTGAVTGNEALDEQIQAVLLEVCADKTEESERLEAIYSWMLDSIKYRASAAESPEAFTDEVITALAETSMGKRRTDCDGEAALMAVFLRRMGYDAHVIRGQFVREIGQDPVDHAWVLAEVSGKMLHFDSLYGRFYAEDRAMDYCGAEDALMSKTHTWQDAIGE